MPISTGTVDQGQAGTDPWPVTVAAVPLPTGAATAAKQDTGNASLASIDGKIVAVNTGAVVVASSALPTGAAAEHITAASPHATRLSDGAAFYDATKTGQLPAALVGGRLDVNVGNAVAVTGSFFQATQPVSGTIAVSNFPATQPVSGTVAATQSGTWNITNISGTISLPTGAATSALQTTGNTSLASIDTKTPTLVGGRQPVDGSGVTQPVSGTVAISGSVAVTGTFFQATQPVSGTVTANQGGAPWSMNQTQVNGIAVATGNGVTGTGVQRVTIASDQALFPLTAQAAVIAPGPSNWTSATALDSLAFASSPDLYPGITVSYSRVGAVSAGAITFEVSDAGGTIFPVQAVRMDTLVAETTFAFTTSLTQVWMIDARGWSIVRVRLSTAIVGAGTVTIRLQGSTVSTATRAIVNQQRSAVSSVTSVAASATNVTLLALNALRLGGSVYNDSTVTMTLKLGATASATSKTLDVYATGYYPIPDGYTGIIDALWASATGSARITELSV